MKVTLSTGHVVPVRIVKKIYIGRKPAMQVAYNGREFVAVKNGGWREWSMDNGKEGTGEGRSDRTGDCE
jgi:hypothetical protein